MSERFPKEFLIARYSGKERLAQMVVKMKDVVGALASINAITAGEGADIRQSVTFSGPGKQYAVYNSFVALPKDYDISRLEKKLRESSYVLGVTVKEGVEGAVVDTSTFPVLFSGRRSVLLGTDALVEMFDDLQNVFGTGGSVIIYQQGANYGKALTTELAKTLTRPYMIRNFSYGIGMLQAMGWGIVSVLKASEDLTSATVRVYECFECQGRGKGRHVGFFMAGFLAGIFSFLAGKELQAKETKCVATGEKYCEFSIS